MARLKHLLLLMCLIMSVISASAMKIVTDEIDEFTGKRTVITSWESLSSNKMHIRFRLQGGRKILDFKYSPDQSVVIGEDDNLCFKSTTDSIAIFVPLKTYVGGIGNGAVGLNGSGLWGINASYKGDIRWFNDNVSRLIRIYTTDGYYDESIKEIDGKKIIKLYQLFDSVLSGESGSIVFANYNLSFLKRKSPTAPWDVVKEEYVEDLSSDELQKIVDDWKSQSTDKVTYDVKIKKAK